MEQLIGSTAPAQNVIITTLCKFRGDEIQSAYLISVVGPGGPFHVAALEVEREVFDVDVAG